MTDALPKPPAVLLRDSSLFLDFDGTLVSLVPRPDLVSVDAHLANLVARLDANLQGRVALLSGRSVENIIGLFGDIRLAIAGSHGAEMRWQDGTKSFPERPAALDRIHATMAEFAHTTTGLLVETKPLGVALHYRGAPEMKVAAHALAGKLSEETGLHLQTGKMMVELRLGGADKGSALRRLMERAPMAGHRPIFLGDDDTDEPAMATAAALGGAGILIGAPRPTNAQYGLPDVAATLAWLESACELAA